MKPKVPIKFKILFVCHPFHKTATKGRESHSLTILGLKKELEKQGHTVDILETKVLFPKIKKGKYNIVHGFSGSSLKAISTWWIGKQYGAATIHTIKSINPIWYGGYSFARVLNIIDYITVPSDNMWMVFGGKGVSLNKMGIVHSNIDVKKFEPKKVKKPKWLEGRPMVFYWGALWGEKGVEDLVEASKRLLTVNFVVIPRYDHPEQIKNLKEAGLNFYLLESKTDIVKYLNMCDIVCLPYRTLDRTEGNPSCMLEAWANKKPVVTTDIPDLYHLAEDKVLWAKPNDPEDLANTIHVLLETHSLRKNIAKAGYQKRGRYDHKKIAAEFDNLYFCTWCKRFN